MTTNLSLQSKMKSQGRALGEHQEPRRALGEYPPPNSQLDPGWMDPRCVARIQPEANKGRSMGC